jgi:hypothetical protein
VLLVTDAGDVSSLVTDDDIVDLHFIGAGACKLMLEMADFGISAATSTITVSSPSSGHHDFDD